MGESIVYVSGRVTQTQEFTKRCNKQATQADIFEASRRSDRTADAATHLMGSKHRCIQVAFGPSKEADEHSLHLGVAHS